MISVLIPVFNRNVVALVEALHSQVSAVKEKVEIIVMDDASDNDLLKKENRTQLIKFSSANYIELQENAGRNIIRHKLAAAATFDTLIFLDADSSFPDALWLQRYISNAVKGNEVIMGGRLYNRKHAGAEALHFHYGICREQCSAAERNKYPYRSFLACNFLISKQQLSQLIIDNHLQGYCHEDTFMGLQFEQSGVIVKHLDNPVFHEGIDGDEVFMNKQQQALDNLQYLYLTYQNRYDFSAIKLIRVYKKITGIAAGRFLLDRMMSQKNKYRKTVLSTHRLFWLDSWKLLSWHALSRQ